MNNKIGEFSYVYCEDCKRIRYGQELNETNQGLQCSKCKSYKLESSGWVQCPQHKFSAVFCPRSGKGIKKGGSAGYFCEDSCSFRL